MASYALVVILRPLIMNVSQLFRKDNKNNEGFILVATGQKYRDEAIQAVASIRKHGGGRKVALVTDHIDTSIEAHFDIVTYHPNANFNYRDKISPLIKLPFKRCLFVDSDVTFIGGVDELFEMLKVFDFIGSFAPVRWCQWKDENAPESFVEINSGVIGLRRSSKQRKLIRKWLKIYDNAGVSFDQASLRSALWWASAKIDLKSWVLPMEYNLRTPKPWLTGCGIPVKIIHGRMDEQEVTKLADYLNQDIDTFRSHSAFPTQINQSIRPA